jgi:hypothetical protein
MLLLLEEWSKMFYHFERFSLTFIKPEMEGPRQISYTGNGWIPD